MTRKVLVPLADGSEEIEAVTVIDVLRRAGASVTVASVGALQITASRGVKLVADKLISECIGETYDLIALPGGMPGAENLRDAKDLTALLKAQQAEGRWYAAICAAPAVVFAPHGLLAGRHATCHPSFAGDLPPGVLANDPVVVDDRCVTSQGPGTAMAFALKLVALLFGEEKAASVAAPMVLPVIK